MFTVPQSHTLSAPRDAIFALRFGKRQKLKRDLQKILDNTSRLSRTEQTRFGTLCTLFAPMRAAALQPNEVIARTPNGLRYCSLETM